MPSTSTRWIDATPPRWRTIQRRVASCARLLLSVLWSAWSGLRVANRVKAGEAFLDCRTPLACELPVVAIDEAIAAMTYDEQCRAHGNPNGKSMHLWASTSAFNETPLHNISSSGRTARIYQRGEGMPTGTYEFRKRPVFAPALW